MVKRHHNSTFPPNYIKKAYLRRDIKNKEWNTPDYSFLDTKKYRPIARTILNELLFPIQECATQFNTIGMPTGAINAARAYWWRKSIVERRGRETVLPAERGDSWVEVLSIGSLVCYISKTYFSSQLLYEGIDSRQKKQLPF